MRRPHPLLALALGPVWAACSEGPVVLESASARVEVDRDPFDLRVMDDEGRVLLSFARDNVAQDGKYAGIAGTEDLWFEEPQLLPGWDGYVANEVKWRASMKVERVVQRDAHTLEIALAGDVQTALVIHLDGARVDLRVSTSPVKDGKDVDKLSLAFNLEDDDAFFGLGERYTRVNHRGQSLFSWAEEGGLGEGEDTPASKGSLNDHAGDANPFPNGPSMTYFPVPFLLGSRGFGMYLDTTRRTEVHLGSEQKDAWRVAVNGDSLHAVIYVHADPLKTLRDYTEDTGRPPVPAPWVFGPRRRVGSGQSVNGVPEIEVLRTLHVPTTGVDDAVHFLPHRSEVGREAELRQWTQDAHALGYKVMAYNNPYVSESEPAAHDDYAYGAEHGYFLLDEQGQPGLTFFVSGTGQTLATIDLTNPDAVAWFQSLLQRTLDIGYDGWMHDFGEYVARGWTAHDGSTGEELHNRFPVLSAKAAFDLLERERHGDYLFFVRSGYAGTQAVVPAVWGGDPEATFDETQGIPSQLRAGVNLGLSGVPYWGSDTTGFKCLTNFPRDKDVYLRWAELSALSPIMMEQNACSNPLNPGQTKWTLYSDDETTRVYGDMARLHTRMLPYFLMLAHQAHETGAPLMRHPFLVHPDIAATHAVDDAFYLGDRVYVMPVVRRAQVERTGWLPPGFWLDVTDMTAISGGDNGREVIVPAPIGKLPWFLKVGTILPLLDARVETLAPEQSPDIVSLNDTRDMLTALAFIGGEPHVEVTLVDGTTLSVDRVEHEDTPLSEVDEAAMELCTSCRHDEGVPHFNQFRVNLPIQQDVTTYVRNHAFTVTGTAKSVHWIVVE